MGNVVVVGAQWGDEGKGKIVDWLAEKADVVVRFQGGHNAGHTLVIDGIKYKLSLLPSGIVRGKTSVVGNGVVLNPWAFLEEMERISALGVKINPEILKIAENVTLILPLHSELDKIREEAAGKGKIGTTGRGIGPSYEDKVARRSIRLCDLADEEMLEHKVDRLLAHHNPLRKGLGVEEVNKAELMQALREIAPKILPYSTVVWDLLDSEQKKGSTLLFEGAQGIMLDNDFGTYPFVTSSNTIAGSAAVGSGVGAKSVSYVLGIAKAYTTRVGSGPFPTELFDEVGDKICEVGCEFGTVTGRKRRPGWFDAVLVRQAVKVSGISAIAMTKLDVLDGFKEIKICVGYKLGDKVMHTYPSSMSGQANVEPIYEVLPGWSEKTQNVRDFDKLPENAKKYIKRVEELIEAPITIVSTSPEREDTILLQNPFNG